MEGCNCWNYFFSFDVVRTLTDSGKNIEYVEQEIGKKRIIILN